jgi:hypothetical protein
MGGKQGSEGKMAVLFRVSCEFPLRRVHPPVLVARMISILDLLGSDVGNVRQDGTRLLLEPMCLGETVCCRI